MSLDVALGAFFFFFFCFITIKMGPVFLSVPHALSCGHKRSPTHHMCINLLLKIVPSMHYIPLFRQSLLELLHPTVSKKAVCLSFF